MLSHISVLPLQHEWMQESRSVGSMIRLAADYEGSDRRSRTCWQRKTNVLAEEAERSGCGRRLCWRGKANALAVWGQALWQRKTSALAVENECACCGRQVRLLWKESGFQKDVRRAGERGNVGWQVRRREPMTMRGLVDLSGGVGRRRNECALLGIAWESGQENASRCICHLSALRCPLQRAAFAIAPRSVLSAISIRRLSRRFLRFPQKLKPVAVRAAGRASFPPSLPQPQPFLLPVALPCHFFPSILR